VSAKLGMEVEAEKALATLSHAFTHFKLHIQPQPLRVVSMQSKAQEAGQIWLSIDDAIGAAIPTPVRKLLLNLKKQVGVGSKVSEVFLQ
jgi:A/G-specific adenine glycosylase